MSRNNTPPRYRKKNHKSNKPFKVVSSVEGDSGKHNNNGKTTGQSPAPSATPISKSNNQATFTYFPPERVSLWPSEFFKTATQPYRLVSRNWKQEIIHLFAVFFLVLILYALTTPQYVTLEDDGLFISNLEFFGVAHPPGYPIHTFLGGIFYHLLPFGTPAFKGHFFSGFVGAIACSAVYASVIMLVRGRVFGYLAGLGYGASKTFWSQAIIAEVYTLNSTFFFIVLALCIKYSSQIGRPGKQHIKILCAIGFIYGLGIANHYPLLGLGTTGLFLLVLSQLKNILSNSPKALLMLLLGALPPYAWMVVRSFEITPANFYGPIESWKQFLFYVQRSGYSGVDKQSGVGIEDKIEFGSQLADEMLWQFTPLGFVFVVFGFFSLLCSRYNWLLLSLAVSWFTSSVMLVFLLDFKASYIWLAAFRVYHLLAYGIMAIWMAVGCAWFVDKLRFIPSIARRQIGGIFVLAIVGGSIFSHWEINNRSDYRWAHDLAVAKINSVEANAVLFTFDDLDLPVGYLHFVEGVRPDLKVYNDQGLVYGERLFSPLIPDHPIPQAPQQETKQGILTQFIDETKRPIYYHTQRQKLYQHPSYGSDFMGFFRRVNYDSNNDRVILSDLLKNWLNQNVGIGSQITDLWTRQQHYSTVTQLVSAVLLASLHGFELDDVWQEIIERARRNNVQTRIVTTSQYLSAQRWDKGQIERELEWFENFDIDKEDLIDKNGKSSFFVLLSDLILRTRGKDDPSFEQTLLRSLKYNQESSSPAINPLLDFYNEKERYCEFIELVETYFPDTEDIPTDKLRLIRQVRQKSVCPTNTSSDK